MDSVRGNTPRGLRGRDGGCIGGNDNGVGSSSIKIVTRNEDKGLVVLIRQPFRLKEIIKRKRGGGNAGQVDIRRCDRPLYMTVVIVAFGIPTKIEAVITAVPGIRTSLIRAMPQISCNREIIIISGKTGIKFFRT